MKKLYALMLSVLAVVMLAGSFSTADAQSYTLSDITVRTIPNNFQEISGSEITSLRNSPGYYIGPAGSTITSPFPIRLNNFTTTQMRVSGNGTCYLVNTTTPAAGQMPMGWSYAYAEQYGEGYSYGYSYDYGSYMYSYGPYNQLGLFDYYFYDYTSAGYGANYAYVPLCTALGYPYTTFNGQQINLQYTSEGSAPNRKFIVQMMYRGGYPYSYINNVNVADNGFGSWQVVFFETPTNIPTKVQYHYRRDKTNDNTAQTGDFCYVYDYNYNAGSYIYRYYQTYIAGTGIRNDGSTGGNGYIIMNLNNMPANTVLSVGTHYTRTTKYGVKTTFPQVGLEFAYYYPYDLTFANGSEIPLNNSVRSLNVPFDPTVKLANRGRNPYSTAQLRCKIDLVGTGNVYDQLVNVSGLQMPAVFSNDGSAAPSVFSTFTPTNYGIYNMTVSIVTASPVWPDNYTPNNSYATTFTVSPDNDLRSVAILNPTDNSRTPVNIGMPITVRFHNSGVLNQASGRVSAVVKNPSGVVVYRDTVTFTNWASGQYRDTTFRDFTPTTLG